MSVSDGVGEDNNAHRDVLVYERTNNALEDDHSDYDSGNEDSDMESSFDPADIETLLQQTSLKHMKLCGVHFLDLLHDNGKTLFWNKLKSLDFSCRVETVDIMFNATCTGTFCNIKVS